MHIVSASYISVQAIQICEVPHVLVYRLDMHKLVLYTRV